MEITRKRLAILSILVVLTQQSSGENEKGIDWKRCDTPADSDGTATGNAEAQCYISRKCKGLTTNLKNFERLSDSGDIQNTNNGVCETGIQIKPYGAYKWLVYMQLKVEGEQLDPAAGVWLQGGPTKYFGCKKSSSGIEYYAHEPDSLKIEAYPKAEGKVEANGIFCAFIVRHSDSRSLDTILKGKGTLKYKTDSEKEFIMPNHLNILATVVNKLETCNPDNAEYDTTPIDGMITQKILITEKTNNVCPAEAGKLYVKLSSSQEYVETTDIECKPEKKGTDEFTYSFHYTPKDKPSVPIPKGDTFKVHCAFSACAVCKELVKTDMPTDNAEIAVFTDGDKTTGKCAETKCGAKGDEPWADNWEYKDDSGNLVTKVAPVECRKKGTNDAAFFLKDTTIELKDAWCSKTIQCSQKMPLKYKCPDNSKCTASNDTAADFGCGNFLRAKGIDTIIENLSCDNQTGTWTYGKDKKNHLNKTSVEVYCLISDTAGKSDPSTGGLTTLQSCITGLLVVALVVVIAGIAWFIIRRRRRFTASEREERRRPRKSFWRKIFPERLVVDDLSMIKDWSEETFCKIMEQWLKFSVYERKKFAERIGFELGMTTTATCFLRIMTRAFEIEPDYRVWQVLVPTFKLLHAQTTDKDNNLDVDKRLRKWCVAQCKPILERVGWEGCNNEWRDTAYQRYLIFNLLYYCEDKDFVEKLLEFFDKGKFHGLHSINRQVAWAAAVREKDQFEVAKRVADDAVCDKNAMREIAARKAKANGGKQPSSSGGLFSKSKTTSDAPASDKSGKNAKSKAGSAKDKKGGSKETLASKGGSKESKSSASKEKTKSDRSNKSDKSGKKKGSKETPSGKAKKAKEKGDSKEESNSSKRNKKGGSKEARKGGSKEKREKGGADSKEESGKEKKAQSEKDRKKDKSGKSGKDKKGSKESGKDKDRSGKSSKEKKDKSDKSNKSKKDKSGKEAKTCSEKATKSGKSGKDKKDKSNKSSKTTSGKEAKTAKDKTIENSGKSKKSTASAKARKKPATLGYKERRDADGDKLHGDRAQHIFFAIGSCRSKEQIAAFIDYYVTCKEYDPSNLVYLFAATLEWDDTRSYGLDLFVNMNKVAFKKMPPGDKYHMRILKNFRRYNHMTSDRNYTNKDFGKIDIPKMVKRIQNNVAYQKTIVDDLDEALKKLNF